MKAKSHWIENGGDSEEFDWYRAILQHEDDFADLIPASIQPENHRLLLSLPLPAWRETRRKNLALLRELLGWSGCPALLPATLGLAIVIPSPASADSVRSQLVTRHVYPARLWPQPPEADWADKDLADRIMLIHTDHRYSHTEMAEVAQALETARKVTHEIATPD